MINLEERFESLIHFGVHLEAKAVRDHIKYLREHEYAAEKIIDCVLEFIEPHIDMEKENALIEAAKNGIEVELDSVGDLVAASDAHEAECDKDYPAPRRCR